MPPKRPSDPNAIARDPQRLAAVYASGLLNTPAEECFDQLTRVAAEAIDVPAAMLSVVTPDGIFCKSMFGISEPFATTRQMEGESFCHYAIVSEGPLILDDARKYAIFQNVRSLKTLGVVAYVGVPMFFRGQPVGAFCVVDFKPRRWDRVEIDAILSLARVTLQEIERRAEARAVNAEVRAPEPTALQLSPAVAHTFEWLYDNHASVVYPLLIQMLRNEDDARETLQEVFLQAWRQFSRFDPSRSSLSGWLICIARSRALDRLRGKARRPKEEPMDREVLLRPDKSSADFEIQLQERPLRSALSHLPQPQREVIDLAYFGGMTQSEIAQHIGEPLGTVKSRTLLGMKKLREVFVTDSRA